MKFILEFEFEAHMELAIEMSDCKHAPPPSNFEYMKICWEEDRKPAKCKLVSNEENGFRPEGHLKYKVPVGSVSLFVSLLLKNFQKQTIGPSVE